MRRIIKYVSCILLICMILPLMSVFAGDAVWQDSGRLVVDDTPQALTRGIICQNGDYYIPLTELADALDCTCRFSAEDGAITVTDEDTEAVLYYNSRVYTVNGTPCESAVEPLLIRSEGSYVNVLCFAVTFDIACRIDEAGYTVILDTDNSFRGVAAASNDGYTTRTITYYANGGSNAPAVQQELYGGDMTISLQKPDRANHQFLGWGLSSTAAEATYQPGDVYTGKSNLDLYALWKLLAYSVKYDPYGGTNAPAEQKKYPDSPLTLSAQIPLYRGYRFSGWSVSGQAYGDIYQPGDIYNKNENIELRAIWSEIKVESVSMNRNSYQLQPGGSVKLTAIVRPADALRNSVTWVSSNPSIAQVDNNGAVRASTYNEGVAIITAISEDETARDTCKITVSPYTVQREFSDVKPDAWYRDAVMWACSRGITTGTTDTTFSPKMPTTRAMLVTFLAKMAGVDLTRYPSNTPFTDVNPEKYYARPISWAHEKGIVAGKADSWFGYSDTTTRQEIAVVLYGFASSIDGVDTAKTTAPGALDRFNDKDSISSWARDAVSWAASVGLIAGDQNGNILPKSEATRAELVQMLCTYETRVYPSLSE